MQSNKSNNKHLVNKHQEMSVLCPRYIISTAILLIALSVIALGVNAYIYHFPGNNYFPPNTWFIAFSLILMYSGFHLQFGRDNQFTVMLKEVIYFFMLMSVIALATNAAQYTPFNTIDSHIINLESILHIDMPSIMLWTHDKPTISELLAFIYDTLPFQMTYIPLLIIASKQFDAIHEYYFLLLVSAILGFTFYYFFPTTAPASVVASPYFSETQQATGLKFTQLHHYIQPSTIEGGMIALPSFHVIWAWFCLYLLRGWPVLFCFLLPINTLLINSCVLLGWHYSIDILGAIIIILISHALYVACKKSKSAQQCLGKTSLI